jgi:ribonuclease T1
MSRRTLSAIGALAAVVVVALAGWLLGAGESSTSGSSSPPSYAGTVTSAPTDPVSGLPWVDEQELPGQARDTLQLIDAGGPFPYPGKDGSTFNNLEGLLPEHDRGYYAEYTVPTPGSRDRGARRIITGDGGEYYWTADHYEHFDRIRR